MKPWMCRRSSRTWRWRWSWLTTLRRTSNRNRNGITISDSLPKCLGRPWPPFLFIKHLLPLDFPLLRPPHTTSMSRVRVCVVTLDGHLLQNYALSPAFSMDARAIFSQPKTTQRSIKNALNKITIEQGMPPLSDPWVMKNIVKEALRSCLLKAEFEITQTEFVEALRSVLMEVASRLKARPLRISQIITTYDGRSIKQFLNNKHQLEKALKMTWKSLPKEHHGNLSREYVRVGLDILAPAAGLPPWGAVHEMDEVVSQILKMVEGQEQERGDLNRKEFKKLMLEIMCSLMHELERYSISVSSNAVITHKLPSKSTT